MEKISQNGRKGYFVSNIFYTFASLILDVLLLKNIRTMAVNYVLTQEGNPADPKALKKYCARSKAGGKFTLRKLSRVIAEKSPAIIDMSPVAVGKRQVIAGKFPAIIDMYPAIIENIPAATDKYPATVGKSPAIIDMYSAVVGKRIVAIGESPAVVGKRPAVVGRFLAVIDKLPVVGKQSDKYTINDILVRYNKLKKELI
jgi:hypothetical protein